MNVPLLGIRPLNPNEVLARLPEETQNDEEVKEARQVSFKFIKRNAIRKYKY